MMVSMACTGEMAFPFGNHLLIEPTAFAAKGVKREVIDRSR